MLFKVLKLSCLKNYFLYIYSSDSQSGRYRPLGGSAAIQGGGDDHRCIWAAMNNCKGTVKALNKEEKIKKKSFMYFAHNA